MITTHSHMLVSDLPVNRSAVSLWEGMDGIYGNGRAYQV